MTGEREYQIFPNLLLMMSEERRDNCAPAKYVDGKESKRTGKSR